MITKLTQEEIRKIEEAQVRLQNHVNVTSGNPDVALFEGERVPGLLVGTQFHHLVYTGIGYHLGKTPSMVTKGPDGWVCKK